MLTAIPQNLLSQDFDIQREGETVAHLDVSFFGRSAGIEMTDVQLVANKTGLFRPTYTLSRNGAMIAGAEKATFFRDTVQLHLGDVTCEIRRKRLFGMQYHVFRGEEHVGSIKKQRWLSRRADIDLPDEWPIALQVFVFWIVLLFWKRDASASSNH